MLEAKQLNFDVEGKALLSNIDMVFEEGKIYGLIGHNGSGKSTLLKMLANQQTPSSGDVMLKNKPVAQWNNKKFARQVAYLPQQLPAADTLTGKELISFGRYPWHGLLGRLSNKDSHYIEQAIQLTQTEKFNERLVDTLSGGERQRVWLAMLLAQNARYLLLDEPLAALDIAHQIEVLTLIRDLSKTLNLGIIIVLHDINIAARFCDHIVAMHSGKILTHGSVDDLLTSEVLEDIYGIPMQVMMHSVGYPVAMPCKMDDKQ